MNEEQLIAEAILQLKQESNILKDYIFPIAMALFSSLIGALMGYWIYLRQERVAIEKRKLEIINKWILMADEIQQSLIAIKFNYHKKLCNDPLKRLFAIPYILIDEKIFDFPYQELVFLSDNSTSKWNNIPYIRTLFSNYPSIICMLKARNETIEKIKIRLLASTPLNTSFVDLDFQTILNLSDQSELAKALDLSEWLIVLIDSLIGEFDHFLNEFPEIAKQKIDFKFIKGYGSILTYKPNKNDEFNLILEKAPLPDYKKISKILGQTEEELMARYRPLFDIKK